MNIFENIIELIIKIIANNEKSEQNFQLIMYPSTWQKNSKYVQTTIAF